MNLYSTPVHLYNAPVHLCREAGGLYKLIIRQLSYRELTNFTCRAENEVGYNKGVIEVTGNQCSPVWSTGLLRDCET